jgi:hypothetical protein
LVIAAPLVERHDLGGLRPGDDSRYPFGGCAQRVVE